MSETNSVNPLEQTSDPTPTGNSVPSPILDAVNQTMRERLGVGGMGEVYRIGDPALQRDLAIKVLKETLRGNVDAEERFLREARLTGSLQHPAIVPVHQLGRLADGRPYYTMKLVRGRTFADMIREEPQGPERLPRLLAIVEKVCQAVAYAHSKGVIHRDLKPGNVMVGEFGEVQVMDWGLAKELSREEPAPSAEATREVETVARMEEGEGLSRAGLALGTPEYMPPEQAAGDWDIVDQRADVFALGAILCAVLTGKPPYSGGSRDELLRRARRGDVAEALGQLEKCGTDGVLVVLCRECLAAERLQRPRHAGVVAERLASYQAEVRERLRLAELERARSEVKALEERKRRRLLTLIAMMAFVLVVGGGAAWWQWRAKADGEVSEALGQARSLWEQARLEVLTASGYDKALAAAQRANEIANAGAASVAMRRQAEQLLREVQEETEEAAKDRRLLAALLEVHSPREVPKFSRDDKGMMMTIAEPSMEEQFASAFREWGLNVDSVTTAEAVARVKARPAEVVTEIIAALDEWAGQRRRDSKSKAECQRVAALASALDTDSNSLRRELREITARGKIPLERALGTLSAALRPVPLSVEVPLGEDRRQLKRLAERIDVASEPVLGVLTLTQALREAGEEALAERLLRGAMIARPREVVLYHTWGQLLTRQNPPRWAEAVEFHRVAQVLRPDLGVSLSEALRNSGHTDEGLALIVRMVHENPDNPYLHLEQGVTLYVQGKFAEAEAAWRQAIALKQDYRLAYHNLGAILSDKQEKHVVAELMFHKAIALEPDSADDHRCLGIVLYRQGRYVEAEAAFRKAIALKPDYTIVHLSLGAILNDHQRKHKEAEAVFREAIALKPDYADAYANLGVALIDQGKYADAEAACHRAIALEPENVNAYSTLGVALLNDPRKLAEAEAALRKAIALKPDHTNAYSNLGIALKFKGEYEEEEAVYRKAIALKPKDNRAATLYAGLGDALISQGKHTEAVAACRMAIALKPDNDTATRAFAILGPALDGEGKGVEAEAAFRKVIALQPDNAWTYMALGSVLQRQGRFQDSLSAFGRYAELLSKQFGTTMLCPEAGAVVRLMEMERKNPAVLQGTAAPPNPDDAVILAEQMYRQYKKLYAASARLYSDAFAAKPKLAADMMDEWYRYKWHRYHAACSAALAAAGRGEDARLLPDKVAVMFRRWALGWLRDDLAAYANLAEQNNPTSNKMIQQRMTHWRSDADLASVRDPQALDRLSDNERAAWQALWRDVDELRSRVEKREGPTKGR